MLFCFDLKIKSKAVDIFKNINIYVPRIHPANFGDNRDCGIGDIKPLIYRAISQYQGLKSYLTL